MSRSSYRRQYHRSRIGMSYADGFVAPRMHAHRRVPYYRGYAASALRASGYSRNFAVTRCHGARSVPARRRSALDGSTLTGLTSLLLCSGGVLMLIAACR